MFWSKNKIMCYFIDLENNKIEKAKLIPGVGNVVTYKGFKYALDPKHKPHVFIKGYSAQVIFDKFLEDQTLRASRSFTIAYNSKLLNDLRYIAQSKTQDIIMWILLALNVIMLMFILRIGGFI